LDVLQVLLVTNHSTHSRLTSSRETLVKKLDGFLERVLNEMTQLNQTNKKLVWNFWQQLDSAQPNQIESITQSVMSENLQWYGFDPIGELQGVKTFSTEFWQPLLHSFPNLKRQTHIFCSGKSNGRIDGDISKDGRMWVSGTGYFNGTFANDYLSIPATSKPVSIRWGEFCCIENNKITEIVLKTIKLPRFISNLT